MKLDTRTTLIGLAALAFLVGYEISVYRWAVQAGMDARFVLSAASWAGAFATFIYASLVGGWIAVVEDGRIRMARMKLVAPGAVAASFVVGALGIRCALWMIA